MSESVVTARDSLQHSIEAIQNTDISTEPFPHLIVDGVFPEEYYEQMLAHFPDPANMADPLTEQHDFEARQADFVPDPGVPRGIAEYGDGKWETDGLQWSGEWELENLEIDEQNVEFWSEFRDQYFSSEFVQALRERFGDAVEGDTDSIGLGRLSVDRQGSGLGPHTDRVDNQISAIFSLASEYDEELAEACGTDLLTPQDEDLKGSTEHFEYDQFTVEKIAEYVPNRLLVWPVGDDSFHAYNQTADTDRKTIKYFVHGKSGLESFTDSRRE